MRNSPHDLRVLFLEKRSGVPKPISGRANRVMLTLNPKMEIIQAVTVVPTLAPIITAIDCPRVIRPALTKLTTITVDADELCIRAVINIPVNIPENRFFVITARILRSLSPATFCNPSLMTFIPYRNKPTDPIRVRKSRNVYSIKVS